MYAGMHVLLHMHFYTPHKTNTLRQLPFPRLSRGLRRNLESYAPLTEHSSNINTLSIAIPISAVWQQWC